MKKGYKKGVTAQRHNGKMGNLFHIPRPSTLLQPRVYL
jgi:hypothetical protein